MCSRHIKLGHSEREVIIYDWKVNNNHTLAGRTRRPTLWLNPANTPSSRHPTAPSHGKLSRDVPMADAKARKRPRVEWTAVEAVDGAGNSAFLYATKLGHAAVRDELRSRGAGSAAGPPHLMMKSRRAVMDRALRSTVCYAQLKRC